MRSRGQIGELDEAVVLVPSRVPSALPADRRPDPAPLLERASWLSEDGIAVVEAGRIAWANPALHTIVAVPAGSLIDSSVDVIELSERGPSVGTSQAVGTNEAAGARVAVHLRDLARHQGRHRVGLRRLDGSTVAVEVRCERLDAIPDGRWVLTLREISAEVRADEALRTSEARFRALADNAPIGVFLSDVGTRLGFVNARFAQVWGQDGDALLGGEWMDAVIERDRPRVVEVVAAALSGEDGDVCFGVARPDGDVRTVEARFVALEGSDRQACFVGSVEDVTDAKARGAELAWQASHDALTGLPNRIEMWDRIKCHMATAGTPAALLFFDLDDFKLVNDSLGHQAGDTLLREVARRLADAIRLDDVVARFGGDEFVVFCPGTAVEAEAVKIAARLLDILRQPVDVAGRQVRVTASVGVLLSTSDQRDPEALLRDADVAMYQAKAAGKARCAVFDAEARRRVEHRLAIVSDLRRALAEGEVGVEYQPIYRHDGLGIVAAEALLRFAHSSLGPIPANEVIAIAESSGCIDELGAYVLDRSCADLAAWRSRLDGWAPEYVTVNIAAAQLAGDDFPARVAAALADHGLVPADLCLELTESQLMTDVHRAEEVLREIAATGVRLAIDDFGTGYSSLAYLRRFPVSLVKIERSFVADLDDPFVAAIVEAVVSVTTALGGAVVAEGVETTDQLETLGGLGCSLVQGYLLARPMPAERLPDDARHPGPKDTEEI